MTVKELIMFLNVCVELGREDQKVVFLGEHEEMPVSGVTFGEGEVVLS